MAKCPECGQENVEGTPLCRSCGATLTLTSDERAADHAAASDSEVLELVRQGKKIDAIKRYRELHGVGLAEAKAAVEQLADGGTPAAEASAEADDDVLQLMHDGKKIAAIKVYRERYHVGLKEAKEAVEALASQHGIAAQGSGCTAVVLLGFVGLAGGAWCIWC